MAGVAEEFVTKIRLDGAAEYGRQLQSVGAGWKSLAADSSLAGLASSSLLYFEHAASAAAEAQKVQVELRASLAGLGDTSDATIGKMERFATAMQDVTIYEDDAIVKGMALLGNMGMSADSFQGLTKAAISLSAITGKDLTESFTAVGGAVNGLTRGVKRYIPGIAEAGTRQERLNVLLEWGNRNLFKAEALTGTTAGQIARFHNAVTNLNESIGESANRVRGLAFQAITPLVNGLTALNSSTGGWLASTVYATTMAAALGAGLATLRAGLKMLRTELGLTSMSMMDMAAAMVGAGEMSQREIELYAYGAGMSASAYSKARGVGILRSAGALAAKPGIGLIGGAALGMAGDAVGGTAGGVMSTVGMGLTGAGLGSMILPGWGTAIGAAAGLAIGAYQQIRSKDAETATMNGKLDEMIGAIKEQTMVIVGSSERAARAVTLGDYQRAAAGVLAAQIV